MKMKIAILAMSTVAFIACGSTNMRYPDKTTKIDLKGKSVLVIAEENATGDKSAGTAFVAAVGQKVGTIKILPGVPAAAMGISKTYAEFGLKNQGIINPQDPKAMALDGILKLASNLGTFDTIVFVSAEKASGFAAPMTVKLELFGAIYDIKAQKVTAAVTDSGTVVTTTAIAQMPLKARGITDELLNGYTEEDKKEEKK